MTTRMQAALAVATLGMYLGLGAMLHAVAADAPYQKLIRDIRLKPQ